MQSKTIKYLSIALFVMLLLWGTYTLLVYLGVPYHGLVLLERSTFDSLQAVCGPTEFWCRGLHSFWPYLERSFNRIFLWYADGKAHTSPFFWYVLISAVIYVLFIGWNSFKTGQVEFRWKFRPWHVLLMFLASVWLIFTMLATVQHGKDVFPRQMVEPLPQVYKNVGPEAIEALKANMEQLEESGCLVLKGQYDSGARVFSMKRICIQKMFITRVLSIMVFILLLLFELLIAGRAVIRWLKLKPDSLRVESMLSVGLGACVFIALLWFLAVISLHTRLPLFSTTAGWLVFVAIPLLGVRHTRYWVKQLISASWKVERRAWDPVILLSWLLLSYLALNFLSVVRPFPIGWDDLGSYLNRPRLMVSYGHFIFSMAPFFWEYLTSLGFLLFGYESHFGATAAMMINWSAGLLATLSVFTFTSVFLGKGRGILAALLYYTLPMVGHFSFADMKIDNAVFLMGTLSTLCVFYYLFIPQNEENTEASPCRSLKWLMVAGIFAGFAFSIKITAAMLIAALGAIIAGVLLHWSASVSIAVLFMVNYVNITRTIERIFGEGTTVSLELIKMITIIAVVALFLFLSWRYRTRLKRTLIALVVFGGCAFISIAPWIEHNNILHGNIIPRLELKAPNYLVPHFNIQGTSDLNGKYTVRSLPPDLVVDKSHPLCTPSGGKEELDRYWGFRKGWGHYLTLPWRVVMNMDSTGYYVTTMPALLLFPLLLLLPFFWMRKARWMRWLFFGTCFMLVEWMFLANGIIWYGLGTFLGLIVLLEALSAKAPDKLNRIAVGVLIGFSLIIVLALRFWQFETQKNLFEYPMGKSSADVMIERTVPHYDDIAEVVVERNKQFPNRPYLYRMGTFIPYFIPRNLEIIGIQDHQLDFFNCLYQERDAKLTLERIKSLGFNSIIFDTNTATIEQDPNGSLHQKVNAFIDWVNNPELGLQIVISDTKAGVAFLLIP